MRISRLEIKNFRGIKEASMPLSAHACAIGPNNTGKSSFLIALSLFLSGNKLSSSDYYNPSEDIAIIGCIEGITEKYLEQLIEDHRDRIKEIVENESIILVRRYDMLGKSTLRCMRKLPKDKKFSSEEIDKTMTGKKGSELKNAILQTYPEIQDKITGISTQKDFKALITSFIKELPEDQMEFVEAPLPTGISNSVSVLLPEAIYIPAVKDVTDDIKTKETTSFGKILKVLLDLISETDELKEVSSSFTKLKSLLNKETKEDGTILDNRLPQIKEVESVVGKLLLEQFPYAGLDFEIPPPELKTVFSGARIFINDGIRDVIETKGDGMKRAITFALLRGYVEIREKIKANESIEVENSLGSRYLFLFEEPELYLHPKAQRTLYDALGEIAKDHQVCVSTHSPYFFSPESTETFLRFEKSKPEEAGKPPFTIIYPVDLIKDISKKDAFQILCFENNNAAFFCDQVVLCEGDSDIIYLKHLSKTISSDWDFDKKNIGLIQIGGKGNFARYREFFSCFDVPVQIIADLDVIIEQFEGLEVSNECSKLRDELLNEINRLIEKNGVFDITADQARKIVGQNTFKERYDRAKEVARKIADSKQVTPDELNDFQNLFIKEKEYHQRKILKENIEIKEKKVQLIDALRKERIHVFLKGSIDDYYPRDVEGRDKPTRALSACKKIKTKDDVFNICDNISYKEKNIPELQAIFDSIFNTVYKGN
ncbi:MAG TPA: ATP-dependent nuclease [Candidatus Wujingus californicus]|uniref:ATP-dependent nuclease n=1 Tax=Candidatus Wujingus californicus TaxID=3367618 RepID=UPI0040295453